MIFRIIKVAFLQMHGHLLKKFYSIFSIPKGHKINNIRLHKHFEPELDHAVKAFDLPDLTTLDPFMALIVI